MTIELTKQIFWSQLSSMKKTLDLLEFKYGKESDEFKYLKKNIMDDVYNGLKKLFALLETNRIVEKCSCHANLRHGYKDCKFCGGSGFKNLELKTE